jgi:hypothetical protein
MNSNRKNPNSIDNQMLKYINSLGHGAVFVPTDFLDFGSRQVVDIVLHRLIRKRTIRRLARGIYSRSGFLHCQKRQSKLDRLYSRKFQFKRL